MDNIGLFVENFQIIPVLAPAPDLFASSQNSAPISMKLLEKLVFIMNIKSGGTNTGTGKVQVMACSSFSSSNPVAVPFYYSRKTPGLTNDSMVLAPALAVAATGFTTVANENTTYVFEVNQRDLPDGKPYVYVDTTQVVNDAVLGSIVAIGSNARFGPSIPAGSFPTALS